MDSAVLGKYNLWRREYDNEHADPKVKFMRDQITMSELYMDLAKSKNRLDIYEELLNRLKESQRITGKANADADLPQRSPPPVCLTNAISNYYNEILYFQCTGGD